MNPVRVTVINHDDELLALTDELLTGMGFEVATYADAFPGIDEIVASRPDLLIVDLGLMPKREQMTGLQVIHSARSGSALRDTPIIVSTSDPDALAAAWTDLMARGDIHQLLKPFDLATFERVVSTALGTARGTSRATGPGRVLAEDDGENHRERDEQGG